MADLQTNYYLEAFDSYPYDLKQTSEMLNYALAYDDEHAPSLCLKGKLIAEQMKNPREAAHYYELALIYDKDYPETYLAYIDLLLENKQFIKARKIIELAEGIPSICEACLFTRKSQWFERQQLLKAAKNALKHALSVSINNGEIQCIKDDLARIKEKIKQRTPQVHRK